MIKHCKAGDILYINLCDYASHPIVAEQVRVLVAGIRGVSVIRENGRMRDCARSELFYSIEELKSEITKEYVEQIRHATTRIKLISEYKYE